MAFASILTVRRLHHLYGAAAIVCTLALSAAVPAQTLVRYGDPARSGTIANANQSHRFLLMDAQAGDTLRVTFCSQNSGNPYYTYFHRLDVWEGLNPVGTIEGLGPLTVTLPKTTIYTIEIRARNNQSTGWYAFQLDRLNDPVGADRIALDWNMKGSISSTAGFVMYTLRAEAGSTASLRVTCQNSGNPYYTYFHYAELVDSAGNPVAAVPGGNGSAQVTFQQTGIYTLFIGARNYQSTGWYAASVECDSWPATPCDCTAHSSNYGAGWPGTSGVPALTASTLPKLGRVADVFVGNSSGAPTDALLFIGLDTANLTFSAYGGTLLVTPLLQVPLTLPPAGLTLPLPIPNNDPLFCGIGLALQSIQNDPGAQTGPFAFSRGLLLLLGR